MNKLLSVFIHQAKGKNDDDDEKLLVKETSVSANKYENMSY